MYPEELIIAIALVVMAIVFVQSPLPFRWLDGALWFVLFERLVFSWFVFMLLLILQSAWRGQWAWSNLLLATRVWLTFYLGLIVYFNIKINVGVWRAVLYDPWLHQVDQTFHWFIQAVLVWHPWVDSWIDLAPWYGVVYEFAFLCTFTLFALLRRPVFRLLFSATMLTLLLGAVGYWLFPALGPFLYDLPASPYMQQVLPVMYQKYYAYVSSAGSNYLPTFLIQGLAAMPSLHIAHMVVFSYFVWKHLRWLSVLYFPVTLFIFLEAMYTKYHYLLDLVVGIGVAAVGISLTYLLYAWRARTLLPVADRS